jgi:hypothetical protein
LIAPIKQHPIKGTERNFTLPAFGGANLPRFGFTKFCPLGIILKK